MNKAFFRQMRAQMQPDDELMERLRGRLSALPCHKAPAKAWKPAAAAAAVLLAAGAAAFAFRPFAPAVFKPGGGSGSAVQSGAASSDFLGQITPWEDRAFLQKYVELDFGGSAYTMSSSERVSPEQLGARLGDALAKGYDEHDTAHTQGCTVYALKSIASPCAVAVKYEGYDGYYPYENMQYKPATLGDFIRDLDLRRNLVFGTIDYEYWEGGTPPHGHSVFMEYTLPDPSVIWNLLLSDPTLKNEGDAHYGPAVMDISVDVLTLGSRNISLGVTEDGYLDTNILGTGKAFYLGPEKVRAFIDYVRAHGAGKVTDAGSGAQSETESGGASGAASSRSGSGPVTENSPSRAQAGP